MKSELYKPIPNFEDYHINKKGDIISYRRKTPIMLKPKIDKDGYSEVGLRDKYGVRKYLRVHRLVAITYLPNPDNYPVVNHKNGKKSDNRVGNLEWCSISYNTRHGFDKLGRKPNITTNIPISLWHTNGELIGDFTSMIELSEYLNIGYQNLWNYIRGRNKTLRNIDMSQYIITINEGVTTNKTAVQVIEKGVE